MTLVELKAIFSGHARSQFMSDHVIELKDPIASATNEMSMVGVTGEHVSRRGSKQVRVRDDLMLSESLERPIDRRKANPRGRLLCVLVHVFGGSVPMNLKHGKHEHTCWSDPQPLLAQQLSPSLRCSLR